MGAGPTIQTQIWPLNRYAHARLEELSKIVDETARLVGKMWERRWFIHQFW